MGKSQRDKGAGYEREIARLLTAALGVEFKRRLGQAREGGHDLTNPLDLVPELKRRKREIAAVGWLRQAEQACRAPDQIPVVIHRGDGGRNVAVLYLDDFVRIFKGFLFARMLDAADPPPKEDDA